MLCNNGNKKKLVKLKTTHLKLNRQNDFNSPRQIISIRYTFCYSKIISNLDTTSLYIMQATQPKSQTMNCELFFLFLNVLLIALTTSKESWFIFFIILLESVVENSVLNILKSPTYYAMKDSQYQSTREIMDSI